MFGTGFYIVCAFLIGLATGTLMSFAKKELEIKNLNERLSNVVIEYNKLYMDVIRKGVAEQEINYLKGQS